MYFNLGFTVKAIVNPILVVAKLAMFYAIKRNNQVEKRQIRIMSNFMEFFAFFKKYEEITCNFWWLLYNIKVK